MTTHVFDSRAITRRVALSCAGALLCLLVPALAGAQTSYDYRVLATSKTSTMQKELQEASDAGFQYRDQTVFKSTFGGQEVVCILERDKDATAGGFDYKLLATTKTSTLERELREAGSAGYEVMGLTVSKTVIGGKELVAITRKAK